MQVTPALSFEPVFIDGLTTSLSYVILAVKQAPEYNCVCLRNNGTLKFYPNFEFWGVTEQQLRDIKMDKLYSREPYQGNHCTTTDSVEKLLAILQGQRQTAVVPAHMVAGVFETPASVRGRSRMLHPQVSGQRPISLPSWEQVQALPAPESSPNVPLMLAFG